MAELKPCPFCGGEAEMIIINLGNGIKVYLPRCKEKFCCGRVARKWEDLYTAVYAWNRRARNG